MTRWFKKKISRKIFIMMFISVILPVFAITLTSYVLTRNVVRDMMVSETERLFREGKRNLTFYFDDINRSSLFPYHNQMIEKSLYTYIQEDYDDESESFFLDTLSNMKDYEDEIEQIYMYIEPLDRAFLLRGYMLINRTTLDEPARLLDIGENEVQLMSQAPLDDYAMTHIMELDESVISFVRNFYEVPGNAFLGQVVIDINDSIFEELMGNLYETSTEQMHLVNLQDGKILYSSKEELKGTVMEEEMLTASLNNIEEESYNFIWKDEAFAGVNVVDTVEEPYMNLLLIKQIPDAVIYQNLDNLLKFIMFLAIAAGLLLLVTGSVNAYLFTRPIHALVRTIRSIREGDMHHKAEVTSEDEFGELQEHFNEMMQSINDHIDQEYLLTIENTRNELKALQSQINSHFMNNILQSIGTETLREGNKKAYRLIVMLGEMMQYSMRHQKAVVTIADELKYCTSYLELQRNRYRNKFEYAIIKNGEVDSVPIPKMTLQPVIENCFIHGFKESIEEGRIELNIARDEHQVTIRVKDNGAGISEEKLIEMNAVLASGSFSDEKSIGMGNIVKRLGFYYKNQAEMTFSGREGEGFEVTIVIPVVMPVSAGKIEAGRMEHEAFDS